MTVALSTAFLAARLASTTWQTRVWRAVGCHAPDVHCNRGLRRAIFVHTNERAAAFTATSGKDTGESWSSCDLGLEQFTASTRDAWRHSVQLNIHTTSVVSMNQPLVTRCHDHGGGLCQAAEYAVGLAQAVDGSDAASEGERSRRYILCVKGFFEYVKGMNLFLNQSRGGSRFPISRATISLATALGGVQSGDIRPR